MSDPADDLARINALTSNARNTWFALLGVLVFVGITLMGVKHIDFYGVDRDTKLPLVDVAVPTRSFFVAAPILTAAIYGYFHLYLIRLWDVLGDAPTRINGTRLGDAVSPWLVTDAALHFRNRVRRDNCTRPRTLEGASMLLNIVLAWVFGLVILYYLWQQSMPARAYELTAVAGLAFAVSIVVGASSIAMMMRRMMRASDGKPPNLWATPLQITGVAVGSVALLYGSYERTNGSAGNLAQLTMIDEDIVERPKGWLPYQIAHKDFRLAWCAREELTDCKDIGKKEQEFSAEWRAHRLNKLSEMHRSDWHKIGRDKPDFRNAALNASFFVGADLSGAPMQGADLSHALVEGADLTRAQLDGAKFHHSQIEGADFTGAIMTGADLSHAQMNGADFHRAQLQGAKFMYAQMEDADFRFASMRQTDLEGANMIGTQFRFADMSGAKFDYGYLAGQPTVSISLKETKLDAVTNHGGAFRYVDLMESGFDSDTDFRNAFIDGSVTRPAEFDVQMGTPCQWVSHTITDDAEFFGRWRGWIRHANSPAKGTWKFIAPAGWRDVTPIPPPTDCKWKTGTIASVGASD